MSTTVHHADIVLGIDVGTQSAKCVVLDGDGQLRGVGQHGYPVLTPRPNWAEQDPAAWWDAVVPAVRDALRAAAIAPAHVQGIGLTGQMHGAVILGPDLTPLRPAIIWMDRRSANLCADIQARLTPQQVIDIAGNRLSPGFAGASLAWLRQAEPDTLARARAVVQPKDYIALRLTGELSSDPSDASATWLYDIRARAWSATGAAWGVPTALLPPLRNPPPSWRVHANPQQHNLMRPGIPVVAGAADRPALLVGWASE